MRFAFAIYRYFPHGGLQGDMLRMAQEALRRGHEVRIFVHQWRGPEPEKGITLRSVPASGFSNHAKMASFGRNFLDLLNQEGPFDTVVTFNRVPGGDLYFAADNCLKEEWQTMHHAWTLRLHPRYRAFLAQEACVCMDPKCRIMYISLRQKREYQQSYNIPDERFLALPPGMNPACRRPENAPEIRQEIRQKLGLKEEDLMLILVGSDFRRKGGERVIRATASLPEAWRRRIRLFLVGSASPKQCAKLARKLGIERQVVFTGGRSDIPELLLGADLMVHPARSEATGTVLIEGLAAGLPVIASGICGFADYAEEANPGLVTPEPFQQQDLDRILLNALTRLPELKRRTIEYASRTDFCRRAAVAVDAMESH